jgi:hypothetical protein
VIGIRMWHDQLSSTAATPPRVLGSIKKVVVLILRGECCRTATPGRVVGSAELIRRNDLRERTLLSSLVPASWPGLSPRKSEPSDLRMTRAATMTWRMRRLGKKPGRRSVANGRPGPAKRLVLRSN